MIAKRIAIFTIYSPDGYFDRYIYYLANSIKTITQKLVITVNGSISSIDLERIRSISEYIYVRENKGLDGGAYKDTILNFLSNEDWTAWDELILLNDSFYGPLYPWDRVFSVMNNEDADFWGLSSYLSDYSGSPDRSKMLWPYHIQSYFLVIRNTLLKDMAFLEFWDKLEYSDDYWICIEKFEVGFSYFFRKIGFKSMSYLEVTASEYNEREEVFYITNASELIKNKAFPVVKYKAFSPLYSQKNKELLSTVSDNTDYPVEYIIEHNKKMDRDGRVRYFSPAILDEFVREHEEIYIFGHGKIAKAFKEYFNERNRRVERFIVTNKTEEDDEIIELSDFEPNDKAGIIVAVGEKYYKEVIPELEKMLNKNQLFTLKY